MAVRLSVTLEDFKKMMADNAVKDGVISALRNELAGYKAMTVDGELTPEEAAKIE